MVRGSRMGCFGLDSVREPRDPERSTAGMKKNKGFTLIELIIAVAVLSIMTAVLFQTFAVSRRMNTKAQKDERVLDAAKRTMEELKGYAFEKLDVLAEHDPAGDVIIADRFYEYEPLESAAGEPDLTGEQFGALPGEDIKDTAPDHVGGERQGYRLTTEYKRDPKDLSENAAYLIIAEADWGRYNLDEETDIKTSYSINQYQMPNIADVSSFQNVVMDPGTLSKDDELMAGELLLKVNPEEEEDEEDGENSDSGMEEEDTSEEQTVYTKEQIRKYLQLIMKESGSAEDETGRLTVRVRAAYTVDGAGSDALPDSLADLDSDLTLTTDLVSYKKKVALDPKTNEPVNRIYLFLPDAGTAAGDSEAMSYEKIFISSQLEHDFEFYVVASSGQAGMKKDELLAFENGFVDSREEAPRKKADEDGNLVLYTNLEKEMPVSLYQAEKRLYRLTVTVYEAVYENENTSEKPTKGKEILKLDSTKTE